MDLLEYQAKQLFSEVGIPVLPSQRIDDPRDLKRLNIPYPVVLKSQVRAGGRGRVGGIRFVENTIDAIAAARNIFNLSICDEYPQVLLAEARYDVEQEFFLAVVQDYKQQRPVLLGSAQGGIQIEAVLEQLQAVVIEDNFSPFYARKLARKMGLNGVLIESVSSIVEKMYQLFITKDLDLIEINPLGTNVQGEVMALDGKISANDYALERHPELLTLAAFQPSAESSENSSPLDSSSPLSVHWIDTSASIAILSNSSGLALATWDALVQKNIQPAGYVLVENEISEEVRLPCFSQLEQGIEKLLEVSGINVILINLLSHPQTSEKIANEIAPLWQRQSLEPSAIRGEERSDRPTSTVARRRSRSTRSRSNNQRSGNKHPSLVVYLAGSDLESTPEYPTLSRVHWLENLEDAVTKAISLAKS